MQSKIIAEIEKDLSEYDRIFVFDNRNNNITAFLEKLAGYISVSPINKKILLVSIQEAGFGHSLCCKQISSDAYEMLYKLYSMYEFSDRIQFITHDITYGSLFNYLKTGVMTEQELFEALLY